MMGLVFLFMFLSFITFVVGVGTLVWYGYHGFGDPLIFIIGQLWIGLSLLFLTSMRTLDE